MQTAEKKGATPAVSAATHPLSAWLFFRRNLSRTAPVALVIVLSVVLIGTVVTIIRSIDLTVLTVYGYNRYFLVAVPRNGNQVDPRAQAIIRAEPLASQIYRISVCFTNIHTIFGKFPFVLFGLTQEEMPQMLRLTRMRLVEGRLPREGEAACALSVGIARNRNLKIGDVVLAPHIEDSFAPVPVKLVGLLDGENWFAVISKEFVQQHYFPPLEEIVVAAPTPEQQPELDRRLDKALDKRQVRLFTYGQLVRELRSSLRNLYLIMNIVIMIVVLVIAIMMGMLSNIFFMQTVAGVRPAGSDGLYARHVAVACGAGNRAAGGYRLDGGRVVEHGYPVGAVLVGFRAARDAVAADGLASIPVHHSGADCGAGIRGDVGGTAPAGDGPCAGDRAEGVGRCCGQTRSPWLIGKRSVWCWR